MHRKESRRLNFLRLTDLEALHKEEVKAKEEHLNAGDWKACFLQLQNFPL
jgi:hypothetical protein